MTTTLEEIVIDTGGDPYGSGDKWRPAPNVAGYDIAFIHNDSWERVYSHTEVYHATKARLQNKPEWVSRAKYMAQDAAGAWHMFEEKPKALGDSWYQESGDAWSFMSDGHVLGNWRDTLEVRPVELQYDPDDVAFKFNESEVEGTVLFNGEIGGEAAQPPIGWHGECTWGTKSHWCECVVLPAGDVAWRSGSWSPWEIYEHGDVDFSFRPFQSERDKATDAMIAVIADDFVGSANDARKACRALYDAGYRKTGGGECKN